MRNFSFFRYCTEILAQLPFSLPDEPLYLVYSINRVIQVRAGMLEANMKASLHSLQNVHKSNGSGTIQPPSSLPVDSIAIDNREQEAQEELERHCVSAYASEDSHLQTMTSGNSYYISADDMKKIQVRSLLFLMI